MKRTKILNKVVTLLVIASLCASFTACNDNPQIDDRTTVTTRTTESEMGETGMSEPNQTIDPVNTDPTTSETSETAAPAGKYSYTLYAGTANEVTISMDVNIDDYILPIQSGGEFLQLGRLASDLGWLEQGQYNWDDIINAAPGSNIGTANWYTYSYGDHRAMFVLDSYPEKMPGTDRSQIWAITFSYLENDSNANFFPDGKAGGVGFAKHYDAVCYAIGGQNCMCSRDDAIVITYGLWFFANNPSDGAPFISVFEQFRTSQGNIELP